MRELHFLPYLRKLELIHPKALVHFSTYLSSPVKESISVENEILFGDDKRSRSNEIPNLLTEGMMPTLIGVFVWFFGKPRGLVYCCCFGLPTADNLVCLHFYAKQKKQDKKSKFQENSTNIHETVRGVAKRSM